MPKITYVLYGVADRDPDELVCMFFDTQDELREFAADLPGVYDSMKLRGVTTDDFVPYGVKRVPQAPPVAVPTFHELSHLLFADPARPGRYTAFLPESPE